MLKTKRSSRYWSEGRGEVVSRHSQAFIRKADAQTLHEKIHTANSRANLPIQQAAAADWFRWT